MDVSRDARAALADAVALWRLLDGAAASDIIDAATQALVDGLDSPTLRELAGASPKASWFFLNPIIEQTLEELEMSDLLRESAQQTALRAMVRRFQAGTVSGRELARWAHLNIGHDGDAECRPFVELDDMYDIAEYVGYTEQQLDGWTAEEAEAFLAGRPSPGRADWRAAQASPPSQTPRTPPDRIRAWLNRTR